MGFDTGNSMVGIKGELEGRTVMLVGIGCTICPSPGLYVGNDAEMIRNVGFAVGRLDGGGVHLLVGKFVGYGDVRWVEGLGGL